MVNQSLLRSISAMTTLVGRISSLRRRNVFDPMAVYLSADFPIRIPFLSGLVFIVSRGLRIAALEASLEGGTYLVDYYFLLVVAMGGIS
jgi:hypothetical protein